MGNNNLISPPEINDYTVKKHNVGQYLEKEMENAKANLQAALEENNNLKVSLKKFEGDIKNLHGSDLKLKKSNADLELRIEEVTRELSLSKKHFDLLIHATNDTVWDWNIEKKEIWRNEGYKTLLGDHKTGASVESTWINRIHPNDRKRIKKSVTEFLGSGKKLWAEEYQYFRSDQTYVFVADRGYALHDKNGKTIRMIGSMLDLTELKKAKTEIHRTKEELDYHKETLKIIIQTQEEERKRIAELLHNELSQLLFAVKLNLEYLEPKENMINGLLIKQKTENILRDAIKKIKTISFELMPTTLEDFGLEIVLKDFLHMNTRPDFNVKFIISGMNKRLNINLEIAIYRIIQELVNNVIRHSKAHEAKIYLKRRLNVISIIVKDDGIGFEEEKNKISSTGLRSIKNKVKLLNGNMNIEFANPGTIVNIKLHL